MLHETDIANGCPDRGQGLTTVSEFPEEITAEAASILHAIESISGHAWSADACGKLIYLSPATLALLGPTSAEHDPSGHQDTFGWQQLVHPDDWSVVAAR